MRRSFLCKAHNRSFIVALLTVAAFESPTWAQLIADLRAQEPAAPTTTLGEESSEAEDPITPSFAGPILERSKLTGDWCGCRTTLRECGITFDLINMF